VQFSELHLDYALFYQNATHQLHKVDMIGVLVNSKVLIARRRGGVHVCSCPTTRERRNLLDAAALTPGAAFYEELRSRS
jgi:hypothetical protein